MNVEEESSEMLLSEGLLKRGRSRWLNKRYVFFVILCTCLLGILWLSSSGNESSSSPFTPHLNILPTPPNVIDFESTQRDNFIFHFNGSDVMIFLHIQKTGGTTFGKHLVQDINLESPCSCFKNNYSSRKRPKKRRKKKLKCNCFRPGGSNKTWLFSRYSTGWKCGLHADWTELTACVDPYLSKTEGPGTRRYFYITFLREPVSRYLSEFRHVQRGATWKDSKHTCNGRRATSIEIPPCYKPPEENWEDVSLRDFMDCSSNLAVNRMTRMLADLTLVNCYDKLSMSFRERDTILFESAKRNLEIMTFFGLTEEQIASQYLFQKIFNLNFKVNFTQYQRVQGDSTLEELSPEVLSRIEQLNHLDIKLYAYAKELMMKRYRAFKKQNEEDNYSESDKDPEDGDY
ncbi:heparan-sulfate 6-O-sulfotransferase 3 [Lepeophtheirus salmonis]|uniref:Heparan-sulfate 6-O-sulfotransferase n=1 Tax=Lepeophtheirus salmonis TaxID=72036 RepID=A0A0K2THT8_LEPSM|nr:heparan-sulfate 6-O-sulfotransferase 3-like [Lepeophtheirus salmonis]